MSVLLVVGLIVVGIVVGFPEIKNDRVVYIFSIMYLLSRQVGW